MVTSDDIIFFSLNKNDLRKKYHKSEEDRRRTPEDRKRFGYRDLKTDFKFGCLPAFVRRLFSTLGIVNF
jgi:hypothetical protein